MFKAGEFVVATHKAMTRHIGKVGVVLGQSNSMVEVRFLQPTENGERRAVMFVDELVHLTDTKLDKLPYNLVP